MKKYLIIVAGGTGTRMNSNTPKQLMELQGKPILMHTIEKFYQALPGLHIIVVLAENLIDQWKKLCEQKNFIIPHEMVKGGETRYHSVKNGLELVPEACVVGIHDAARPFVSLHTIKNTYETAELYGNAIPVIPINESLRFVKDKKESTAVDRNKYRVVQTPQCFHSSLIKKAFLKPYKPEFTDDAAVLESFGEIIHLVEGNIENIKITTPQDMLLAEVYKLNV